MNNIAIIIRDISKTGGTERATINLANLLKKLDYNVTVISIEGNPEIPLYFSPDPGIRIIYPGLPAISKRPYKYFTWHLKLLLSLRRQVKEQNMHYLIGTGHAINSVLSLFRFQSGTKVIGCEHYAYYSIPLISRLIRRAVYPLLHHVVVLTTFAEREFSFLSRVSRIPNSLSFFPEITASLESNLIIAIGRLSVEKGFDRLISIAVRIKPLFPDWKIKIIGEGDQAEILMNESIKMKVDDYIVFEPFTNKIQEEYLKGSIYVLTSYTEAFPMVVLEAQASGLPVVSYDCPEGPSDIIENGINGYLVKDGDLDGFVSKLAILMKDTTLRKEMGNNARQSSLKYRNESISTLWKQLLENL